MKVRYIYFTIFIVLLVSTPGASKVRMEDPENLRRVSFREDGSFTGTTYDAQLKGDTPNVNYGDSISLNIDGLRPHGHTVIKFPNIFGTGGDQIPPGSEIDLAELTFDCFNQGNVIHAFMLKEDWEEEDVTWNDRKKNLPWSNPGADGPISNNATLYEISSCTKIGKVSFFVTSFVRIWSDGVPNYGIVLIETGNNGVDFYSKDYQKVFSRPMLEVAYLEERISASIFRFINWGIVKIIVIIGVIAIMVMVGKKINLERPLGGRDRSEGTIEEPEEQDPDIIRLLEEKEQIEHMIEISRLKYHKRKIDEESFREIVRNYQEKLITIDALIDSKKTHKRETPKDIFDSIE